MTRSAKKDSSKGKAAPGEKVDFPGLEPLLRKSLGDKELKVIDYSATRLLPPGENYCSVIVKLDAKIQRAKEKEEERLHLVAKTPTGDDKLLVKWSEVFLKELFMYAELLPVYRELERNQGIKEKDLIDILPKYVGHRRSLKERDDDDVPDNDSLILMENIKVQGYDSLERRVGLDFHSASLALSALGRYHALGIVTRQKRPDFFKKASSMAQVLGIDFIQLDEGFKGVLENFRQVSEFKKHSKIIESSFDNIMEGKTYKAPVKEPWATITHGDFWVNNILFHKDKSGKTDDVKLVDFQMYLYNSPLKDLPYFFCGSVDDATMASHFDDLLDVYYNSFTDTLKRMDCSIAPYSREAFDAELKNQAIRELPLIAMACKFFIFEASEVGENNEVAPSAVFGSKISQAYERKLINLISIYTKKGWL